MALRYRGHVTNKKHISTFTRPMYPKLSRVVTQDEKTPLPKSLDSLISWSRNKLKKRISTFTRPINSKLRSVVFLDEGTPPTKSRDDNSKTYLHFHKDCGSQTQKDTGYSVVITIEVCAEGNWQSKHQLISIRLCQNSIIYLMLKKPSRCNGKLVLIENKRKNAKQN